MLVYSAAAMPFQRFETLPTFVDVLGNALRAGAPLGALTALACACGFARVVRSLPVRMALGCAFVMGNAAFCAMALFGAGPGWSLVLAGALEGAGCLGQALAWGRVLARYNLRQATGVVAAAAVPAALLGWLQLAVSEVAAIAIFMACTLACVLLPLVAEPGSLRSAEPHVPPVRVGSARLASQNPRSEAAEPGSLRPAFGHALQCRFPHARLASQNPRSEAAEPGSLRSAKAAAEAGGAAGERGASAGAGLAARVRSFLDVALVPAIGLAFFAMLMAVRGDLFFNDYSHYVAIQVIVALILLACVALPVRVPLLRMVYRGLIPVLSVVLLAVNYLSEALLGGSMAEILLVMTLYTVAALLTLSTLAGMAHAAEFSSDLVVSLAMALFCFVTVCTQEAGANLGPTPGSTRTFIVLTSGLYAAGMILHALWRGLRSEGELPLSARDGADAAPAGVASADVVLAESLDDRCDALAREFGLTAREREILGYLARGHTGVFISDELLISPNTVRTHTHNIYRKLGVSGREDVLRLVRG